MEDDPVIKERFVCVEGNSIEEINERAEWFGIDFNIFGEEGYLKWSKADPGDFTSPFPAFGRHPISMIDWCEWTIVYKNDNLYSNRAVPTDLEPDMSFLNPDYDLDP